MNLQISPASLEGALTPPASKSQAHRLIIAAALSQGTSTIANLALSQDIEATLGCMKALGARFQFDRTSPDVLYVTGLGNHAIPSGVCPCGLTHLDCGESGSTLRFLIPVALAVAGGAFFTGRGRLLARPQTPYASLFQEKGVFFAQESQAITASGTLKAGRYSLAGNVSSQFVTGLLYALPLLAGDSEIVLSTPLESRSYVHMTLLALETFGIQIQETPEGYFVPGNQSYRPSDVRVESDYSQAGFWFAAKGLGHSITLSGLNPDSAQGDRCIVDWYEQLCQPGEVTLDLSQAPDLAPPVAAFGALRPGQLTRIVNAGRLRIKESDRLQTIAQTLQAMGAQVAEGEDWLSITGQKNLAGGVTVSACNDHRIAMMAAIAASRCTKPIVLLGAECVAKSYPGFWEDYQRLGGHISEVF